MKDRPYLRSLADRLGILPEYFDVTGTLRVTPDEARVAILSAMGFDASTETVSALTLAEYDQAQRERLLAPVRVAHVSQSLPPQVRIQVPWPDGAAVDWRVELREEGGGEHVFEGCGEPDADDRSLTVPLNAGLEPGYHEVTAVVDHAGSVVRGRQSFILAPQRCTSVADRSGQHRLFGLWANLYSIRSERNWGIGDLTDWTELARATAAHGAAFVGVNPLHAVQNVGDRVAPYCPVSRLFKSLAYVDIEAVPEFRACPEARTLYSAAEFQETLARLRDSRFVEYEAIATLKTAVLRLLHRAFTITTSGDRRAAFDRFVEQRGEALRAYATYCALAEWLGGAERAGPDWHAWPAAYRSPGSPEVAAFGAEHRDRVEFHRYVQFELDRQLGAAADAAREAGMAIGLYQDLAVGSAADGSDAWSFPGLLLSGVEVGAPPDPYCEDGQTWGFSPVDPRRLRDSGYAYWIELLRGNFRHAGMLRIDHVMGLHRQYWVPEGFSAAQGAYVRFPTEDLLGILALESNRHGAVVVGEDLGTVPPELPSMLEERGVLSSCVFYFERDSDRYHPPQSYRPDALVTATTHDHAPLAGHWTGRDLEVRHEIGLIESEAQWQEALAERDNARRALAEAMEAEGIAFDPATATPAELCAAVYAYLSRTPSVLVGVSLDDLAGQLDPVNLPGVGPKRYRSWSRKMTVGLEELLADAGLVGVLDRLAAQLAPTR